MEALAGVRELVLANAIAIEDLEHSLEKLKSNQKLLEAKLDVLACQSPRKVDSTDWKSHSFNEYGAHRGENDAPPGLGPNKPIDEKTAKDSLAKPRGQLVEEAEEKDAIEKKHLEGWYLVGSNSSESENGEAGPKPKDGRSDTKVTAEEEEQRRSSRTEVEDLLSIVRKPKNTVGTAPLESRDISTRDESTAPADNPIVWFWEKDDGSWVPHGEVSNVTMERARANGEKGCQFWTGGQRYDVDFESMEQINPSSKLKSRVKRQDSEETSGSSSLEEAQEHAARAIRTLLSASLEYDHEVVTIDAVHEVVASDAVPALIRLLESKSSGAQLEAASALANIALSTNQVPHLVQRGAVQALLKLLQKSTSGKVKTQAVLALGNIAGDDAAHEDAVLKEGAMEVVIELAARHGTPVECLRKYTRTIAILCGGSDYSLDRAAIPLLARLTHNPDPEVCVNACWGLSSFSALSRHESKANDQLAHRVQDVIATGVCTRLVELLGGNSGHPGALVPALNTVGAIACGNKAGTQVLLNCHVLKHLSRLLMHTSVQIRKDACRIISKMTAGTAKHIEEVRNAGIIAQLVGIVKTDVNWVRKDAAWAIANAVAGGTRGQIQEMVTCLAVVPPMCDMLEYPEDKVQLVVLKCIDNILRAGVPHGGADQQLDGDSEDFDVSEYARPVVDCFGVDKLDALQSHENVEIRTKALEVMTEFFPED